MNEEQQQDKGSPRYVALVCLVATLGGLLFGYDTGVISDAIGFLTKRFSLDHTWEGWAMSCAILGCAVGATAAGVLGDRLGRKKLLLASAALFAISAVGTALPQNLATFITFRVVGGIGIGMAALASPMYIAEITPARIRGRMISLNQLAIVTGFLLVYFANYYIAGHGDDAWRVQTSWRWMFGLGVAPAMLFFGLLALVPESPRWLVEQGRNDEARHILARVGGTAAADAEMKAIEASIATESATLGELLQPRLRKIMIIGVALAILQQITGINAFLYYGPEIMKKLGTTENTAMLQQIIVGGANLLFTLVAIWTVDKLGRRPLLLIGTAGMGLCLFGMGLAAYFQKVDVWMLLFIIGYIASFAVSVGPVTWVILAEIFPTRVRGRAMAAATLFLWLADFLVTQTAPYLNKDPWLTATFNNAFPFAIYGSMCVLELLFVWRYIPETKGKTLEEIEQMWHRR
jgi:sugar porter (SP) family MFS transporter